MENVTTKQIKLKLNFLLWLWQFSIYPALKKKKENGLLNLYLNFWIFEYNVLWKALISLVSPILLHLTEEK